MINAIPEAKNYEDFKKNLKPGDILLTAKKSNIKYPVSTVNKIIMSNFISSSKVYFGDNLVIGHLPDYGPGFRKENIDYLYKSIGLSIICRPKLTKKQNINFLLFLERRVGSKYSLKDLIKSPIGHIKSQNLIIFLMSNWKI